MSEEWEPTNEDQHMPSEDPTEVEDVLPPESDEPSNESDDGFPAQYSSPEPAVQNLRFNVVRRLPDVDLRYKWVDGECSTMPLPVETASLPKGSYQLVLESVVPDTATDMDWRFINYVEEFGIWVIGDGMTVYGAPEALIPALHGWDLTHDVHKVIRWRTT